jgi:hypothetical protein
MSARGASHVNAVVGGLCALVVVGALGGCPATPSSPPTILPTGTTPNAVALVRCAAGPRLLVAASAEARLDVLDPAGVASADSIFLGEGSLPWDVVTVRHADDDADDADDDSDDSDDTASRAVVTLAGSHAVALVRPCGAPALLQTLHDDERFAVSTPVSLRTPTDVDGDGVPDLRVTQMTPRTPQAVVHRRTDAGDEVVVGFANLLEVSTGTDAPMLTGPALISTFMLNDDDDGRLVLGPRVVVPACENPGSLAVIDARTLAVACAGRYVLSTTGHQKASRGAIVTVERTDGVAAVSGVVVTEDTPGPVLVHDSGLVVGDLLTGALSRLSLAPLSLAETREGPGGIDSAFALIVVDDVVVAGWFDGRLTFDPFGAAELLEAPSGPPRGLVDLVDDGERLWGLMTLSAELHALPREAP